MAGSRVVLLGQQKKEDTTNQGRLEAMAPASPSSHPVAPTSSLKDREVLVSCTRKAREGRQSKGQGYSELDLGEQSKERKFAF